MTEVHDGKQSVETKRAPATRRGPTIVYFFCPWSSLSHTRFHNSQWQAMERAADEAAAQGQFRTFDSMDEMLDFLDAQ